MPLAFNRRSATNHSCVIRSAAADGLKPTATIKCRSATDGEIIRPLEGDVREIRFALISGQDLGHSIVLKCAISTATGERCCHGKIQRPPKAIDEEEQSTHEESSDHARVGSAPEDTFDSQGDVAAAVVRGRRQYLHQDARRHGKSD